MIKVSPFIEVTDDLLVDILSRKTLRLEVGRSYFNEIGEIRHIVERVSDGRYAEYCFVDHMDWSYTKEGIYDLHDTCSGNTDDDLIEEVCYD